MLCHPLRRSEIGFGRDRYQAWFSRQRSKLTDQVSIARADPLVGWKTHSHHVYLRPGGPDDIVEALAQQGSWLVQTWSVDQDELGIRPMHDAADGVPRGLRLCRGDDDLLADQRIGQRGFAGIGAAHYGSEA